VQRKGSFMLWSFLLACLDTTPTDVTKADITQAYIKKNTSTICVGLTMDDPALQSFATEKIRALGGPDATSCLCSNIVDADGMLREGVAIGMHGESNNERAECFSKVLTKPNIGMPIKAIQLFSKLEAPIVQTRLAKIAEDKSVDSKQRAAALEIVAQNEEYIDAALTLSSDSDPLVMAAAIKAMGWHTKSKEARRTIAQNLANEHAEVRAAAIFSLKKHVPIKADSALCKALLGDPEPIVRKAAVEALFKIRRPEGVRCLRELAMKEEPSAEVRDALIKTLGSALGDAKKPAYQALCDAIPFWLKTYVKDDVIDKLKGVHIVKEHNRVDWENSPKCVERAFKASSGYSCYAKMHIALWRNLTSGQAKKTPLCPDMEEYSELK
jgi:HEAT repeat protein